MTPMPPNWEQVPPGTRRVLAAVCLLERARIGELTTATGRTMCAVRESIRYLLRAQLVYRCAWGTYALVTNPRPFRNRYTRRYDFSPRGARFRAHLTNA